MLILGILLVSGVGGRVGDGRRGMMGLHRDERYQAEGEGGGRRDRRS